MKKILKILKFIGLFIWQLPQNLVALVMLPFLGKLTLIDYRNYCYSFACSNMLGGISLGSFVFVANYYKDDLETIAHEQDGHVKQSHYLGPLYLLVIGLPSITWAGVYRSLGYTNYYQFYTEAWANKLAGLIVKQVFQNYYTVEFKDKK